MSRTTGLFIYGILSVIDIADLAVTDGKHPPYAVAAAGAGLGLASLALIVAVRRGRRRALAPLVVLRAISALSAVPAFLVGGVPAPALGLAGAIIALTVVATLLVARPARSAAVAS
jgi:hypothetical protein